jgi:hypothetical protein
MQSPVIGAPRGVRRADSKKLVNKNAVKHKIMYPLEILSKKHEAPFPRNFVKNLSYPSPGFSSVCTYDSAMSATITSVHVTI